MKTFTHKTTILLSPEQHKQLSELAAVAHSSIGALIRRAVVERYMLSDKQRRRNAVESLAQLNVSSGNWAAMEREIVDAKLAALL